MEDLSAEEKEELADFEAELKEHGAAARLATEDGRVGAMSHEDQFNWLISLLERAAEAKGTPLAREQMAFIAEQEALHSSQKARPEKDCRAQAREAVYEVVRHVTPTAYEAEGLVLRRRALGAHAQGVPARAARTPVALRMPPAQLERHRVRWTVMLGTCLPVFARFGIQLKTLGHRVPWDMQSLISASNCDHAQPAGESKSWN